MKLHRANIAPVESPELLGELHPLLEQLGSLEGLVTLDSMSPTLRLPRVGSHQDLRAFLQSYLTSILLPVELPAIYRAFAHASRNEVRELMALDRSIDGEPMLREFASASRRVGQAQLKRLRPLRDHRLVQRYLKAVEAGEADGWHTIVYGVTLALYSVPLRQGLVAYGRQTVRGFIQAAGPSLQISEEESFDLLERISSSLPAAVEKLLNPGPVSAPACL